jgi:hypothetical protein
LSDSIELKDSDSGKLEKLKRISKDAPKIYNSLTLEIIRLFKLMIRFGKYTLIKTGSNDDEEFEGENDFFLLIKHLVVLLEFDTTYPESQKILI